MSRIRVLLVDDSSVVRRMVTGALSQDLELEVVGTAADGQIALNRLEDARPDVVILDVEMPVMGGLETLVALRKVHARLPVIMFSRSTHRGAEATVHALTLGADDYVPKPGDGLSVESCVNDQLIPKIKLLGRQKRASPSSPTVTRSDQGALRARPLDRKRPVEVVVIGASTGGPNALADVIPALPRNWSIPTLIVQHMPPEFTLRLAERLAARSGLNVREGREGNAVSDAQVWIAPGGYHLEVQRRGTVCKLAVHEGPPVNSCRPAADVLFRSAAETYGPGALAVVLTGMGQDGLRGCEAVRAAGGQVVVQNEASSIVWSMPGSVAQAGLADAVLPLKDVGAEIVSRVKQTRVTVGERT